MHTYPQHPAHSLNILFTVESHTVRKQKILESLQRLFRVDLNGFSIVIQNFHGIMSGIKKKKKEKKMLVSFRPGLRDTDWTK